VAGHGGDRREALRLAADPDPRVRAAALGALGRLGALDDPTALAAMSDPDPAVRRRACELAGSEGRSVLVVDGLVRALGDDDVSVAETAAWALGEVGDTCGAAAVAALCHLVQAHPSPLCREAAVAALGAIGDGATLGVVLGALDDTAHVRRRAAIALAAFDDPRAEEGLRRCLADRDWQVRQAAEELLGGD
jgi:HEAT repeat protein